MHIAAFIFVNEFFLFVLSSFIYELLERAQLNYRNKTEVCEALDQISGHLATRECGFLFCSIGVTHLFNDI